jgi:hypothetical protein
VIVAEGRLLRKKDGEPTMKLDKTTSSNEMKQLRVRTKIRAGETKCPETTLDGKKLVSGSCGPGGCSCVYR